MQLNFAADFMVDGGLLDSPSSYRVAMNVLRGPEAEMYSQYAYSVTYTWADTDIDGNVIGAPVSLGTVNYQYTAPHGGYQSPSPDGGGFFSFGEQSVPGNLAGSPSNRGVLELTGYVWAAVGSGRIFASVPEPSALSLLIAASVVILRRKRRSDLRTGTL
jgi:hypothetical protein